jgi:hypothetical protein
MSCCGRNREAQRIPAGFTSDHGPAYVQGTQTASAMRAIDPRASGVMERRPKVIFEYTGRTAMAVIGGATRLRYTFIKPGCRVEVDARDRASMAAVPNLKMIG